MVAQREVSNGKLIVNSGMSSLKVGITISKLRQVGSEDRVYQEENRKVRETNRVKRTVVIQTNRHKPGTGIEPSQMNPNRQLMQLVDRKSEDLSGMVLVSRRFKKEDHRCKLISFTLLLLMVHRDGGVIF